MTNEHKYPYIPKEYYAAVMFACKLIRETGCKNKSVQTAARYYDVDEAEVRKHVDRRNDYGGAWSPYRYHVVVGEYETESEAHEALQKAKEHSNV